MHDRGKSRRGRQARAARRLAAMAGMLSELAGLDDDDFGPGDPFDRPGSHHRHRGPHRRGEGGWRGGPHGRGRRGPGRGRRGRIFDRGELRLALLKLIADQPRHGYDLIKAIEELTGGEFAPSPGVIYPTLQMMLDEGVVAELPDETSRKIFQASEAGHEELTREEEAVAALFARLAAIGEERRSSPHRQIYRAMENLRNALRYHRQAGTLEGTRVESIVDLIDEMARRIERL